MEIELHGDKMRVYEDGRIEKWWKTIGWKEKKGHIHINKNEYKCLVIKINGKQVIMARIVYYAFHQDWDINDSSKNNTIDHIDIDSTNNNITNLRIANAKEQANNRHIRGIIKNAKGYYWDMRLKRWRVRVRYNKKTIQIGCFKTEEEASLAYQNAILKYRTI